MHKTGIWSVCNLHWSQTEDNNNVDYRENINFMYVHLWATQSMNQKTNKTK